MDKYSQGRDLDYDTSDLGNILKQFDNMATVKGDYFLCRQNQIQIIAKLLEDVPIDLASKYTISMSPVNTTDKRALDILKRFSVKLGLGERPGLRVRVGINQFPKTFEQISHLCDVHHSLELFLWLSMRFPGNEVEQTAALTLKEHVIDLISGGLQNSEHHVPLEHDFIDRDHRLRRSWEKESKFRKNRFNLVRYDEVEEIVG